MDNKFEIFEREGVKEFTYDMIYNEIFKRFLLDSEKFADKFNFEAVYAIAGVHDVLKMRLSPEETVEKIRAVLKDSTALRNNLSENRLK